MKFVFATNNKHKVSEVQTVATSIGVGSKPTPTFLTLKEINCFDDIPETADTLKGNALLKARYVKEHFGYNCFADDTGLEVEALDGAPGVYSARYAGAHGDSEANMQKLLQALEGIENRKARFRTVIALVWDDKEYFFEGIIEGVISHEKKGETGFGYDPIFVPNGYDTSFAELGEELKNKISHRALATQKLITFLNS